MRATLTAMALIGPLSGPAFAGEIVSPSMIDRVTVYPDGATIGRQVEVALPAGDTTVVLRDISPSLDPASIRVEGVAEGRLSIGAIDAKLVDSQQRPEDRIAAQKRYQALKDQLDALDGRLESAETRRQFIERYAKEVPFQTKTENGPVTSLDWKAAGLDILKELDSVRADLQKLRIERRTLAEDVARAERELRARPAQRMEVRVELSSADALKAKLRVTYSVRGARWTPFYDARLVPATADSAAKVDIVRRAEILQRTGEDWTDAELTLSTIRTQRGTEAPRIGALILKFYEPPPVSFDRRYRAPAPASAPIVQPAPAPKMAAEQVAEKPAEEVEATPMEGVFQVEFKVPGRVSLASGEAVRKVRLASRVANPDIVVRASPGVEETAFIEAQFKHEEEAPLLPGRVAIYREGVYVGLGNLPLVRRDETVKLGFGADDKVKIARVPLKVRDAPNGIFNQRRVDTVELKITAKSAHPRPVKMIIEDRLPISETGEIVVEPGTIAPAPTVRNPDDRRGVLSWQFDLAPGESKDIRLGWRVRWPADRTLTNEDQRS